MHLCATRHCCTVIWNCLSFLFICLQQTPICKSKILPPTSSWTAIGNMWNAVGTCSQTFHLTHLWLGSCTRSANIAGVDKVEHACWPRLHHSLATSSLFESLPSIRCCIERKFGYLALAPAQESKSLLAVFRIFSLHMSWWCSCYSLSCSNTNQSVQLTRSRLSATYLSPLIKSAE